MRVKKDKNFIVLITIFLLVAVITWSLYFKRYKQTTSVDIHLFPKTIGEWTSRELPISDKEYAILETRNAFVREYSNPEGEQMFLFIVYTENNRKATHPPEVCYTGGGITILENEKDKIPVPKENLVIDVNRLSLEGRGDKQIAFYWFKVGNIFTSSYWKQQILIALKTLVGQSASSALIRVSSPATYENTPQTISVMKNFVRTIIPLLQEYLP